MMMVCCARTRVCMCVCVGGGAWARARARAWAARFGLALGPLARARAEVARANTRCSQDTSPLVLHAFGLHSATPHSPRSPLRARVRGSCSGLGLGTRGSRSGSYSYSGLALDRTLGRCDRNNPVACFPYSAACAGRSVASCFTPYTRSVPGSVEPMRWTA